MVQSATIYAYFVSDLMQITGIIFTVEIRVIYFQIIQLVVLFFRYTKNRAIAAKILILR